MNRIKRTIKNFRDFVKEQLSQIFEPGVKENVFKTSHDKTVLISYITSPFTKGINTKHTNTIECFTAAEIFSGLGYNVDVINYDSNYSSIEFKKYDLIYGMGEAFEKSFYFSNLKKIAYMTGCNPWYSNTASALRVREFYDKTGLLCINSSRVLDKTWKYSTILSDLIITLGNDFVKETYVRETGEGVRLKPLPAFYIDGFEVDIKDKDIFEAKRHFIWWGSTGSIHKGLDIVLDIFSNRSDITIHICGAKDERPFSAYLAEKVKEHKNIVDHGFVNIESEEFKVLMRQCGAVIFPTVSEGGSPALLNVIANGGLIPIISEYSGLDFDDSVFIAEQLNTAGFNKAINRYLTISNAQYINFSQSLKTNIKAKYSYNSYKKNLRLIIEEFLLANNEKNS